MGVKEQEDQTVSPEIVALTETAAMLTTAVQSLNAVALVLLYNQKLKGLTFPEWKDKETLERCVGEELSKCINLVNNLKEDDGPGTTSAS